MSDINDYKIVEGDGINGDTAVENQVREHIAAGWQPLGGIAISHTSERAYYAQALVKHTPPPNFGLMPG